MGSLKNSDHSHNLPGTKPERLAVTVLNRDDFRIEYANAEMISMLRNLDYLGKPISAVADIPPTFEMSLRKCFNDGIPVSFTSKLSADSDTAWKWQAEPLVRDGSVHSVSLIGRVDEREITGSEGHDLFNSLLENAPIGFAFFDRDYRYVHINNLLAELNGLPVGDHLGMSIKDIFPAIADLIMPLIDEVFATNKPMHPLELQAESPSAPGVVTDWLVNFYPVRNNGDTKFVGGFAVEITKQKQIEKQLLESEARFRSLAENSPDIIVRHGKDFRYLYVSPHMEKFTGVKADEYIGKTYREMGFAEEQAQFFDRHLAEVFESKRQCDVEYEIKERGFHIYSRLVPEFDENGDVASVLVLSTEVSATKKTQEELKEIRVRQDQTLAILESLLNNAPIGFAFFDREHRYARINSVLADINGIAPEDHIGRTVAELLPGMSDSVDPIIENIFQTGEPVMNLEISGETPKSPDVTRYWLTGFYPIYSDSGNAVDMVGVVASEITDRKVAETRIKESENRFRILAETLPQMVWTLTPEGKPDWASAQWKKYSGIDNPVKAWIYMIHPDDKEKSEKAWEECIIKGDELFSEVRLRNAEGEYRYHTSVGIPVKDNEGKVIKWVGALTDIHDEKSFAEKMRREVEERTRDLEQKNADLESTELFLATVLDSSVEIVASFDTNLRYTYVNRRAEESLDLDRTEIIGKHILEISPGLENTNFHADLKRALKGERVHISKREIYSKPGTFVENYIIPIINEGNVDGIVTLSRDISQIIQLTDQLQKMVYELQRSNEDLQQFAHVASHDLKEPVRKAMTFGSRLRDEFQDILPEKAKQYIEKMEGATGRMYDMIEGVLRYSSVSAMEHENDEVDLLELLGEIESVLELPLSQKDAKVSYGKLENLRGSRLLFYQLFYNLINNALKFSKANIPLSIVIMSEPADPIEVKHAGLNPAEPHVKIQVSDNGIGFSPEQAGRIFGTFTRLHPKDKYEGTGLGLALCKKIVERHQGSIYAKGKENVGATFVVLLPA